MIFTGNSYGASVSFMMIIAESRPIFITGTTSSEVPGASYTGPKTRRDSPESGTHAKRRFCADNSNRVQYYTHCVRLEETSNFHVWINPIGALYEKIWAFKETSE